MIQYAMHVVPISLIDYLNEGSPKRRELIALLEQGFSIVAVTTTYIVADSVPLVVTLQAPIANAGSDQ